MPSKKTRADQLASIAKWCREDAGLWDILTALRGPDSPSERQCMTGEEHSRAYTGRRERKFRTGEVIRGASVGQVGGARVRIDDHVTLPPENEWDHYDRHVNKAAIALGLKVVVDEGLSSKERLPEGAVVVERGEEQMKIIKKVKSLTHLASAYTHKSISFIISPTPIDDEDEEENDTDIPF